MPRDPSPNAGSLDSATMVFLGLRSRHFGVAVADTRSAGLLEPVAYLVSVTMRIAINITQERNPS